MTTYFLIGALAGVLFVGLFYEFLAFWFLKWRGK